MITPNSADIGCIRIGAVDADELREMKKDDTCRQLINENRIGLELNHDKGTVWVYRTDNEAVLVAKNFVI